MRISAANLSATVLLGVAPLVLGASSWGFEDGSITVQTKGAGVGGGAKQSLAENIPLKAPLEISSTDKLTIALTTREGKTSKRPHQTYLSLTDLTSGLETSFAFSVRDSGKAKLELAYKDIPSALALSGKHLSAALVIASFGSIQPYHAKAFELSFRVDANEPQTIAEKPLRYGKLPEIHHIFRSDPKNPPKVISFFFTLVVLVAFPVLFISWFLLGANFSHLSKAIGSYPVSHLLYFSSIVAIEWVFFMYYRSWNLFQMLPVAAAVGLVVFLSGSRALSEVQQRRLQGLR